VGDGVEAFALGTRVFGIVSGGAYAEYVTVHARELARMPAGLDFVQAASIPEAFVTAYDAMVLQGELAAGDAVLIHAVGSGVGSAAVQIARVVGARSLGTARSAQKLALAKPLGLDAGIVPGTHEGAVSFAKEVLARTDGQGVDVVLDLVGGAYVPESLAALREKGRLVLVGLLAGARADLDLGLVLRRRLTIRGTVMRARPLEEKIAVAQVLERRLAPLFASGALRAVVDRVLPLESAAEAHAYVASNETFGKVVLTV
jgi:NADPH:quinone reductase-like Zn-dependent oxidoreductase